MAADDVYRPGSGSINEILADLRGQSVRFLRSTGNAGDSYLTLVAIDLLRRHGIRFELETVGAATESGPEICVFGGGGNLVSLYEHPVRFLSTVLHRLRRLIILPQSVEGHPDFLRQLDRRVTLFCRDPRSFAHAREACTGGATVLLAEDLGLLGDPDELLKRLRIPVAWRRLRRSVECRCGLGRRWQHPWDRETELRRLERRLLRNGSSRPVLRAFRTDAERPRPEVPGDSVDLSALAFLGSDHPGRVRETFFRWARLIRCFRAVETDRLHLAMVAAQFGIPTVLYPNCYFKNEEVYRYSLAHRFPHLVFESTPERSAG